MSRRYAVEGANASAAAPKTILTLIANATTRGWLEYLVVGCSAAPVDAAGKFDVMRFTAAGTAGSAPAGRAIDPGNPAALLTCGTGHSVEPTYTADSELLTISLNQRATYQWYAQPGGEFVVPTTATNGIGLKVTTHTTATAPACEGTFHWRE